MLRTKLHAFIYLLLAFLIISDAGLYSQIDNQILTGSTKGKIDTLGFERAGTIVKETEGLLETEINPDTYLLGPNDILSISIMTAEPKEFEAIISPEGELLIPEIGMVNLKGKTLSEAVGIIKKQISKVLKTDEVYILMKDIRKFKVTVGGSVLRPSIVSAYAVDRVSEIIEKAGGLDYKASMRKIVLLRDDGQMQIPVDLLRFYLLGDKDANPTVLGGDHILVPPSSESFAVEISGEVPAPNVFEYAEGDSLSTLIKLGQGFLGSSFLDSVEVASYDPAGRLIRRYVDISSWRGKLYVKSKLPGDFPIKPGDRVYVRKNPNWFESDYVVVTGEVKYPGYYPIDDDSDRLSNVITRAGGLLPDASFKSSYILRQEELEERDEELERLRRIPRSEMSEEENRYFQSRKTERKGVMSIDFQKALTDYSSVDNIVLRNKDSIVVLRKKTFINIQGRVNKPGLVNFIPGYEYEDYIALAGGYGYRSDPSETQVAKSKGELFLAEDKNYVLEPGDVILVPPEKESSFVETFTQGLAFAVQMMTIAVLGITLAR